MPEFKKALKKSHNTDLAIILGGMTKMLQPLDVSVNRPFKVLMQQQWSTWMAEGDHTFTPTGRMRKVDLPTICSWIKSAWEKVPTSCITNGFLKCCISNALDGTQDDILWEDSRPEEAPAADTEDCDGDLQYPDLTPQEMQEVLDTQFNDSDMDTSFEGFA